jgi:glyoxylase-like metal-dependent hydrolase (beta-lactamase superfamily II)
MPDDPRLRALALGGPRLYWLDGGGFRLDGGSMFGPVPRPRWSAAYPPADDNTVPLTAHVVLVQLDSSWGLLDAGFGHHLNDRQRRFYTLERDTQLERGLAELSLNASQIDWIVLSHLHLDHAGGIFAGERPAFPNAEVWVQSLEIREAHDASNRAHGVYAGDSLDRLVALSLVHEVDGSVEIKPGVSVHLTGGHSRGHQATIVNGDDGAALLHLGDLLVTAAHLPPAWVSALDDFPLDTIRVKREWLGRAATQDWWVAFSHDARFTAGRLDADGRARDLRPVHQP